MKILVLTSRYTATRDIIGEDFGRQTRLFEALKKFIEQGGNIVTIGSSASLAYHIGIPVKNALVEIVGLVDVCQNNCHGVMYGFES